MKLAGMLPQKSKDCNAQDKPLDQGFRTKTASQLSGCKARSKDTNLKENDLRWTLKRKRGVEETDSEKNDQGSMIRTVFQLSDQGARSLFAERSLNMERRTEDLQEDENHTRRFIMKD